MASKIKVDTLETANGSGSITLNNPISGFTSTGIDDNATSTAVTIDASENVGIGTSSPATALHVQDSTNTAITLEGDSGAGSSFINFASSSLTKAQISGAKEGGSGGNLIFSTNNSSGTSTEAMRIDAAGIVTKPYQPAFLANAATQFNIPVNGYYTVLLQTERFDNNNDFSSNTFTAPVTGKYQLNYHLYLVQMPTNASYFETYLVTSNRTYAAAITPSSYGGGGINYISISTSVLADMDAGDTAIVRMQQGGGTASTDINTNTYFSGYLVA